MRILCDCSNSKCMKPHEPYNHNKYAQAEETTLETTQLNDIEKNEHTQLDGVQLLHRFNPAGIATTWLVKYDKPDETALDIPSGYYTLMTVPDTEAGSTSCTTRLCSLEPHQNVLTVEALSQYGNRNQIWAAPIVGGTLLDLLNHQEKLTLSETSWVAQQISQGLEYLHQHSMGFQQLDASHCAFTADLHAVLLAPDCDVRGRREQEINNQSKHDTQQFARLLWRCMLGEDVPEKCNRLPLNIIVPEVSVSTAELFEQVLSGADSSCTAVELAMALSHDAAPEMPALHRAAPETGRGFLKPLESAETREKNASQGNNHRILKRSRESSNHSVASASRKKNHGILTGGAAEKIIKPKYLVPVSAAVLIAITGLALAPQLFPAQEPAQNEVVAAEVPEENKEVAEPSEDDVVVEMVQTALDRRNETLAQGNQDSIPGYAVIGSSVQKSDQKTIQENTGRTMTAQLMLASIDSFKKDKDLYTVRATVKADRPLEGAQGNDQIYIKDGVPHQQVEMIFQHTKEGWLLVQATPQPTSR